MADKMVTTELNKILLNSMTNIWSKQAFVKGFDCITIFFKKAVNMFKHMKISESIYKAVVHLILK